MMMPIIFEADIAVTVRNYQVRMSPREIIKAEAHQTVAVWMPRFAEACCIEESPDSIEQGSG